MLILDYYQKTNKKVQGFQTQHQEINFLQKVFYKQSA
jgi:hypothetical protein